MIDYQTGDLFSNLPEICIVAHIVNDRGGWGKGFSGAVTRNLGPQPEFQYRKWARAGWSHPVFELGRNLYVQGYGGIWTANMLAQKGYSTSDYKAVQLSALEECLKDLAKAAAHTPICMPLIGCGLGGHSWISVGPLVEEHLSNNHVIVWSEAP